MKVDFAKLADPDVGYSDANTVLCPYAVINILLSLWFNYCNSALHDLG